MHARDHYAVMKAISTLQEPLTPVVLEKVTLRIKLVLAAACYDVGWAPTVVEHGLHAQPCALRNACK